MYSLRIVSFFYFFSDLLHLQRSQPFHFQKTRSGYEVPQTVPFELPEPQPINWKVYPPDSVPKGVKINLNLESLPYKPFSANEFRPLKAPIKSTPYDWDSLSSISFDLDTIQGKSFPVKKFLLPAPIVTAASVPSVWQGGTSAMVRLGQTEGLVGNKVYAMATDPYGSVWITTDRGLTKYDGSEFLTYNFFGRSETGAIEILPKLIFDQQGRLIISGLVTGIYGLDITLGFVEHFQTEKGFIRMDFDAGGKLWGVNGGLYLLDLEKRLISEVGLQKAEELGEVAILLFDELNTLVDNLWTCGLVLCEKNRQKDEWWLSLDNGLIPPFFLPNVGDYAHESLYEGWEKGENYRTVTLENKKLSDHYDWLMNIPIVKQIFEEMEGSGIPRPSWQRLHAAYFKTGYLVIITEVPCKEEDIFKRFAQVFDLTYTRFLDLQKAEAQAKEATKQASLDRVRAVISSMRSAADLELITPLIFKELTILGVPFIRCGVFIIKEKEEIVEAYLSSPEGNSLGALRLPFQASKLTYQTVEAWRKGEVYQQHWNKEDFVQWIEQLMAEDQIQDSNTYQGTAAPPESLDLHFVPFTQGMLYVGAKNPMDEIKLELVQALAKSFSIAYARYEDFEKLEKAKSEVESAMIELKATQSQLVQQEKLASLGQLTAGIAHEIKNPLNFVNNFSEVSRELIAEIKEERAKSQESRDETLVDEILEDISSNLEKIHQHGSRADGIVTSMLQHSRGGSGKLEPTDLNGLIKEYVNLSFHGMRAGKNPIAVDIQFDLDSEINEVPLTKEDFTRVIIHLCNNAFDAMRVKPSKGFQPLEGWKNTNLGLPSKPKLIIVTSSSQEQTTALASPTRSKIKFSSLSSPLKKELREPVLG
jgi:signal transduction histidine kinase